MHAIAVWYRLPKHLQSASIANNSAAITTTITITTTE